MVKREEKRMSFFEAWRQGISFVWPLVIFFAGLWANNFSEEVKAMSGELRVIVNSISDLKSFAASQLEKSAVNQREIAELKAWVLRLEGRVNGTK